MAVMTLCTTSLVVEGGEGERGWNSRPCVFGVESVVAQCTRLPRRTPSTLSLHRDGGGSPVCRFARTEHGRVRLLSAAWLPVAAPVEGHPLAEAVPVGNQQGRCIPSPLIGILCGNSTTRWSNTLPLHQKNVQHPTYKAQDHLPVPLPALRREINEGLNVVEQWNGATYFVFFARRGEMASNRREDHKISMLALHLIQNCMVYVNTLMIQKVLAQRHWQGRFTPRDYSALTPLIWEHVNPYGRFDLDMNTRLDLP